MSNSAMKFLKRNREFIRIKKFDATYLFFILDTLLRH